MSSLLFTLMLRAGVSPIIVTQSAPLFFDDFDATNTSLTGRSGWTAQGDAGKAALIKADGGLGRMTTAFNGEAPYGYQITSAAPGAVRRVEFEYDFSQNGGTISSLVTPFQKYNQQCFVAWQDTTNHTYFEVDTTQNKLKLRKVVAGTDTVITEYTGVPIAATVAIEFRGDRFRVYIGGNLWTPNQLFNAATAAYPDQLFTGTVIKTGGAGLRHNFYALAISKYIKVIDLDEMKINDLTAFYGRTAANNRTISISGTYTGTPVSWAYRLRRKSDGATVTNWATLSATAGAGSWSASVTVGAGGPYYLDVGWTGGDGQTRIGTSNHFSVGILVCYWGQSLSGGMAATGGGFSGTNPLYVAYNSSVGQVGSTYRTWMNAGDKPTPSAYFISAIGVANSLADATGIPVGVAAAGVAGQPLVLLKPGTSNWNTVLVPLITEIGGNVEAWVWSQGEAEGLSADSYASYATDFGDLIAGLRTLGGRSDAKVYVRVIGKDTNKTNTAPEITRAQDVRTILNGLEGTYSGVHTSSAVLGIPYTDNVHPTPAGAVTLGKRDGLTIARRGYSAITYDGRGPLVTGATRSGATITLALDLNGAVSVAGTGLTGYSVSSDEFATTLTISSAAVSVSTIVITLASAPAGAVKIRSFREANFTDTSLALGTYSDGSTIPVFPIVNAVASN